MKKIFNWRNATVGILSLMDCWMWPSKASCTLLPDARKGCIELQCQYARELRIKAFFQWHIDNQVPVVFHNGVWFDIPLVEKLYGMDLSKSSGY